MHRIPSPWVLPLLFLAALARLAPADDRIEFAEETLPNGLRVIYAPLRQAPVVHVRVLYHVGSKDERPDRTGFAHLFEHMMFRGSAHVGPEQHMKLINTVGGSSNAFTSFDQTVYINTVPSNQLELALYLEADRMASFKVSQEIFKTERNVVREESGRRQNQPYGTFFENFAKLFYTKHPYRWTPIGDMEHLAAADASELQQFFNTYYVPNNAILVVAGDIDQAAARKLVARYFGWIPAGAPVARNLPAEPPQTAVRSQVVTERVPLVRMMIAWRTAPYRSDDQYALDMLSNILGGGASSRLDRRLVTSAEPLCQNAGAFAMALEDAGFFGVSAVVLPGKDPERVRAQLLAAVAELVEKGVTKEEMAKTLVQQRTAMVAARETAEDVASVLGAEALMTGEPDRVNQAMARLAALTAEDLQAAARKYLVPDRYTAMEVRPGNAAPQEAPKAAAPAVPAAAGAAPAPREVKFPSDWPQTPPVAGASLKAAFEKGTELQVNGVRVIVMPDSRLPHVTWGLTLRSGGHADPVGKEGLASLTAAMLRRGAAGMSFDQLNEDLESRGISIGVGDSGDITRLSGSSLPEFLDHAFERSRQILTQPNFAPEEFAKLKQQTLSGLKMAEARPETAASQSLARALYSAGPLGRYPTPASIEAITLDDVKRFYIANYRPEEGILVIAGDISLERGQALAKTLVDKWAYAGGDMPKIDYPSVPEQQKLRIILVDRPEGKQSMIRMAARTYDIHSDEKYAGSLASGILSAGIDARLGKYVRAEKGLVYSVWGSFQPARQAGQFNAGAETGLATTAQTIEAMFHVFSTMADKGVTPEELSQAQLRTVGGMVMTMQTIDQQATLRVNGILNGYPIDYFDRYGERVSQVNAAQVREVVAKYLRPERMTVVVVAPAAAVKEQLEKIGQVEVVPMPGR